MSSNSTAPGAPAPSRRLALVVDDDATTRLLVTRSIDGFGFEEVLEAADGAEALQLLAEHDDIVFVITDLVMPEVDGLSLLRQGRQRYPHVTWVILSGLETFDAAAEAVRLGAFDFLTKPPQPQQLMVVVRNALEQQELRAERVRLHRELAAANDELAQRVEELERKSSLLQRDLERAEVIQRALLPRVPPALDQFCIHAVYRPGAFVGGDMYDVLPLSRRHVGIYVADATGHGVTAAMLSVLFKQQLVVTAADGQPLPPAEVLARANRALGEAVDAPGLFLTAVYLLLDLDERTATIASAGHPPVLHVTAGGAASLVRRTGPALGLVGDAQYGEVRVDLGGDDRLLLYTDGLLPPGTAPDDGRIAAALASAEPDPLLSLQALLTGGAEDRSADESDDVTLLLLEVHAGASRFDNGAASSAAAPAAPRARSNTLFYGETEEASFVVVRGRLVWTQCDALYAAARAFQDEGRPLVIDLHDCDYLDSTALGTLHELVLGGGIELQRLSAEVHAMFDELSMDDALAAIRRTALDVPDVEPLEVRGGGAARRRMLEAHEALAGLSERNREAFAAVVEALRQDR